MTLIIINTSLFARSSVLWAPQIRRRRLPARRNWPCLQEKNWGVSLLKITFETTEKSHRDLLNERNTFNA
jgi:hypothetical protein